MTGLRCCINKIEQRFLSAFEVCQHSVKIQVLLLLFFMATYVCHGYVLRDKPQLRTGSSGIRALLPSLSESRNGSNIVDMM